MYVGNRLLSTITKTGSTETTEYHHPDRLGTKLITNPATNTVKEQGTLPYGTSLDAETITRKPTTASDRVTNASPVTIEVGQRDWIMR